MLVAENWSWPLSYCTIKKMIGACALQAHLYNSVLDMDDFAPSAVWFFWRELFFLMCNVYRFASLHAF